MISFKKIQNADAAVMLLLKNLGIVVDPDKISAELEKHPDYPGLLAISDVLNNFNITNAAYRVPAEELEKVPCPFIAQARSDGDEFLVVTRLNADHVLVSNNKWRLHKMKLAEFKKLFSGVVLTAEKGSSPIPSKNNISNMLSTLRTPAIIAGWALVLAVALVFQTSFFSRLNWQLFLLAFAKTAGLVTSILLLVQSIDRNNPLVQKLCQSTGNTNCNAILSSKAANLFKGLSWSEVGFFYFAGTWLVLLFGGNTPLVWYVLAVMNIVSLPYTFYSIYYQAWVAKQWCVLCCTVQALLWLEFTAFITSFSKPFRLPAERVWEGPAPLFICLLIPVLLWLVLKPLLLQLQQLGPLKSQLRTFKYNSELFNNMLTAQPRFALPDENWSIVLGGADANNIITMVTNPYCPPCSETHQQLDEWLNQNPDLQARIVFTASNDENDIKTPVSRHLMALNALPDKTIIKRALHDWYEQKQKSYAAWAKVYPVQLNGAEYNKIDRQKAWCEMAEVSATPTLLLNGYRLPQLYRLPDLKYMLE